MVKKQRHLSQRHPCVIKVTMSRVSLSVIQSDLARKFGYSNMTISRLIRKFAAEKDKSFLFMKKKPTSSQEEELKALREEVLELKKRLYHETMRADFYDTMIDVAEEMLNIEIRKKVGTGQPKGCMKTK